jgi:hypothetical protein
VISTVTRTVVPLASVRSGGVIGPATIAPHRNACSVTVTVFPSSLSGNQSVSTSSFVSSRAGMGNDVSRSASDSGDPPTVTDRSSI